MPGFLSIDMTSSLHYTVEYRCNDTGYWTEEAEFKPKYKTTKTISPHHFLWFVWEKTDTKCHNQHEAEDNARTLALRAARASCARDVRVRCCDHFKDYDYWDTVWINGQFKDC